MERLPESVSTLFAELLEQALLFERMSGLEGNLPGSLVGKTVRGRRYLYWQISAGGRKEQRYLGPDSAELRASIAELERRRESLEADRASLARLGAMLVEGGVATESPTVLAVLSLLARLGLFRRGGVLVGTQAYRLYGNLLGVRLPGATARTQDIAHAIDIAIASESEASPETEEGLAGLGFLPVPGLDPKEATTSFKVRGRELRVDFLTPGSSRGEGKPVRLPGLGLFAQPLPFLGYLIDSPVPALALGREPVLVRVPRPARFALHKLWTASERPVSEQTKATKDRAQARSLIDLLEEERPFDLEEAREALASHPRQRKRIEKELQALGRG